MTSERKTSDQLVAEFVDLLEKAGQLTSSDPRYSMAQAGSKLKEVAVQFMREKVYASDRHAELGMHVEAIMKHFKGL